MIAPALVFLTKMRKQYDIIYVHGFRTLGLPAVIVSQIFHKRCVLAQALIRELSGENFIHGLQRLKNSSSSLIFQTFIRARNWILKKADVFLSISSDITREYREGGINPNKITYIPHGVDIEKFSPVSQKNKIRLRQKLNLPLNKTLVSFVGRFVTYKGLPLLIRIWKETVLTHPDCCLLLIGADCGDPYDCENDLRDFVREHALDGTVLFAGRVENVHEYLQSSDIFVFPSEHEPFGIALLEAMSCGLPVIVSPSGGPKDIVRNGENGIHASNFDEVYKALDSLLKDKSLAGSLGQSARKKVLDSYSIEKMNREYIDLFHSLKDSTYSNTTIGRL